MNLILTHITKYWEQHLAAGTASLVSLSVGGIVQSVIVGVSVFIITSLIKWCWLKVFK